ncbi:MAG: hypothetical protein WAO58_09335 [Fimbriimonadaceae bacterium]
MSITELATLLAGFVGSALALVRFSFNQHKAMAERFVTFLESALRRQEEVNEGFRSAIQELTENVRENSALLARLAERG